MGGCGETGFPRAPAHRGGTCRDAVPLRLYTFLSLCGAAAWEYDMNIGKPGLPRPLPPCGGSGFRGTLSDGEPGFLAATIRPDPYAGPDTPASPKVAISSRILQAA